jgi:hypothetical protein
MLTQKAQDISSGIKDAFGYVCALIMAAIIVSILWALTPFNKDPTDVPGWFSARSGMHHYVDHGTGCEYVGSGSITPRLDRNGKHICNSEVKP